MMTEDDVGSVGLDRVIVIVISISIAVPVTPAFLIDHLHAILVAAFVEIAVREIVETNGFAVKR